MADLVAAFHTLDQPTMPMLATLVNRKPERYSAFPDDAGGAYPQVLPMAVAAVEGRR